SRLSLRRFGAAHVSPALGGLAAAFGIARGAAHGRLVEAAPGALAAASRAALHGLPGRVCPGLRAQRHFPGGAAPGGEGLGGGVPMRFRAVPRRRNPDRPISGRVRLSEWWFPLALSALLLALVWIPFSDAFRRSTDSERFMGLIGST